MLPRGFVAYLLARAIPGDEIDQSLDQIISAMKREIDAHLKPFRDMSAHAEAKELNRVRQRAGDLLGLSKKL
jgi:hypothetical protein